MNLRDQLVKAGLTSKKKADKAGKQARLEQHRKKKKKKKKGETAVADEIAQKVSAKQEAKKERDRELNKKLEIERQQKERTEHAHHLALARDQQDFKADIRYHFVIDGKYIHFILVNESQQRELEKGAMGIVDADPGSRDYRLLKLQDCEEVKAIAPDYVVCLHPPELDK